MSSQSYFSRGLSRPVAISLALGLGLAGTIIVAAPASAATLTVTVETDNAVPDVGSLRWAVAQAVSGDTITFDTSTVDRINLAAELDIPVGITIDGPGPALLTIGRANPGTYYQLGLRPIGPGQDYTIRDLTVEGRPADGSGMGIYSSSNGANYARDITLSNVVIEDEVFAYGPALNIYVMTGDLVIDDSVFQHNTASFDRGGAMSLDSVTGDITITNSLLFENTAETSGGGIDIVSTSAGSEVVIRDTDFVANSAGSGGGLSVRSPSSVELTDAGFFDNTAQLKGGGAYITWDGATDVEQLTLEGATFDGNISVQDGGGLAVDHLAGAFNVTDSTFNGNKSSTVGGAGFNGGGISIDEINARSGIIGSDFVANDDFSGNGGGVFVGSITNALLEVTDSSFIDNLAQLGGGGLAVLSISGTDADGLRVNNSTFAGNGIPNGLAAGGSIEIESLEAPFFMSQSTVDDAEDSHSEYAVYVGEVDYSDVGPALGIGSSTIVGSGGVLIRTHLDGDVIVSHTILDSLSPTRLALEVENVSQGFVVILEFSLLSTATQSYYHSIAGNVFNVADMELGTLAYNGGPTPTRLPANGSPAVNGGDPTVTALTALDPFDQRGVGFARVVGTIDIGAVELQTLALAATGGTINWFLLGGGGALLLLGIGALLFVRMRRAATHRR